MKSLGGTPVTVGYQDGSGSVARVNQAKHMVYDARSGNLVLCGMYFIALQMRLCVIVQIDSGNLLRQIDPSGTFSTLPLYLHFLYELFQFTFDSPRQVNITGTFGITAGTAADVLYVSNTTGLYKIQRPSYTVTTLFDATTSIPGMSHIRENSFNYLYIHSRSISANESHCSARCCRIVL